MPMAAPSVGTPREDLLGAYAEYDPTKIGLISRLVLPPLPVNKRVGKFGIKPLKAYAQRRNTKRGPTGRTSRSEWTPDDGEFALLEYSHEQQVPRVTRDLYLEWFDAEDEAAVQTRQAVEIDYENDVAEALFNRTNFPADDVHGSDVSVPWLSAAAGLPLTDTTTVLEAFLERGLRPDTMVLPAKIAIGLPLNEQIIDRVKYLYGKVTSIDWNAEVFAHIFGVQRVLIPNAAVDGAAPELAASLSQIWSPNYVGFYCTSTGSINAGPSVGRTFEQRDSAGVAMFSYEEPQTKSEIVGAEQHVEAKIIHKGAGYLLGGIAA